MSDTTIRVNKRENRFAQIDRRLINDKRISLDTRAMLIWLLDKPDGWKTTIGSLSSQLPSGRSVVRRMIQESETYGYIQRTATRHKGRFVYIYEVNEYPDNESLTSPCAVNRRGSTDAVQPTRFNRRGSTDAVNRPLNNTDHTDTDHTNTDFTDTDHHHQTQPPATTISTADDDDLKLSNSDNNFSPHLKLAITIAERLPNWTGSAEMLRSLNETQQIAAASWLYLWLLFDPGTWDDQVDWVVAMNKYKVSPFEGVNNIVGKIIAQSRLGNIAPLHREHKEEFDAEIKAIFDDLAQPA